MKLAEWITGYTDDWKSNRDDNYQLNWDEYERLWRGVWAASDRMRESERSRITSPALQQAIENHCSEVEEAIFGQGNHLFDMSDDLKDESPDDVEYVKNYMKECFDRTKLRKKIGDVILLSAIYGTGIGEIQTKSKTYKVPATKPMEDLDLVAVGTEDVEYVSVELHPVAPRNFIIDPTSTCIEDAMGCAVEEFVSAHTIAENIKAGIYKDVDITASAPTDSNLEASSIDDAFDSNKVHVIRYYGLVPKGLLYEDEDGEGFEDLEDSTETTASDSLMENYGDLVEAIVVLANGEVVKAEESSYMMKDRPLVAFQSDTVPGRFWGRGIAEKGFNMQKAIDAQLRTHLDSLALTAVPMAAMDATRMPRGSKFEVRPGKSILTNGNPSEILMPFKFGQTDGSSIETANIFGQMLLQATSTMDMSSLSTQPMGGEMSVSLSGIIKKNKRTLVNFQESFLIPFIEKAAWRFMQYDPEQFPNHDYKFKATGSLGMLAREVEQVQMINLLKTLGPDTPITPILIEGILENSSMPDRQQLITRLREAQRPNPEEQQKQQIEMQLLIENAKAEIAHLYAKADAEKSLAQKYLAEAESEPELTRAKMMAAISTNLPNEDDKISAEFDRRVKIAELMLKEADMEQNKEIVELQMQQKNREKQYGPSESNATREAGLSSEPSSEG